MTDTHPLSSIPTGAFLDIWRRIRTYPPLPRLRSTERGVMQVGLMRVRRGSPHLTSPCGGADFRYFATQRVWRDAANLARSARDMSVSLLLVTPRPPSKGISSEAREGRI